MRAAIKLVIGAIRQSAEKMTQHCKQRTGAA